MHNGNESTITGLIIGTLGEAAGTAALDALAIDARLLAETGPNVSRAAFAMALGAALFDGLLRRVPSGAAYGAERLARGERILFDHGALRTIRFPMGPTGGLPAGHEAFARILAPLGYHVAGVYPLPALRMTGHAYCHRDLPEAIPQYFVSELHVERFDDAFGAAARRVFGGSRDPLGPEEAALLHDFGRHAMVPFARALAMLPRIAAAFERQHGDIRLADYETLLARSAEAGWIATEGNAFNHATDRVADVEALADRLRAANWPIKDHVEISGSGRVRQTAFRADPVERAFLDDDGGRVDRTVPGSFYEFITRETDPATGALDLAFDSGNATGIFAMTRAA